MAGVVHQGGQQRITEPLRHSQSSPPWPVRGKWGPFLSPKTLPTVPPSPSEQPRPCLSLGLRSFSEEKGNLGDWSGTRSASPEYLQPLTSPPYTLTGMPKGYKTLKYLPDRQKDRALSHYKARKVSSWLSVFCRWQQQQESPEKPGGGAGCGAVRGAEASQQLFFWSRLKTRIQRPWVLATFHLTQVAHTPNLVSPAFFFL